MANTPEARGISLDEMADIHDVLAFVRAYSIPVLLYLSPTARDARLDDLIGKTHRSAMIPEA